MPTDRDRRIAHEAAEMLRTSRARERQRLVAFGATGGFILGVALSTLTPLGGAVVLAVSGVLFIVAGRDAVRGGDVAAQVSYGGDEDADYVDTATLAQMGTRERASFGRRAGAGLIAFGVVVLLGVAFEVVVLGRAIL